MANEVAPPKFYTDKHIPKAAVRQLVARGVDIIRCEDVGMGDAADLDHLEFAARQARTIITNDTDFIRLHHQWQAQGRFHGGILFCESPVQGNRAVGRIVSEVMMYHELIVGGAGTVEQDIANQLIFVR